MGDAEKFLVEIEGAAVGSKAGVPDEGFRLFDGRKPVIFEHVLFYHNAVDVVGTGMKP